ncbi:hypothetical protein [Niveispirillum fermenti]|uniref:hypothetical protein n=1 Tax=Niveispirillum fermenti TaxID=1233113 RepID=UPI003A841801
MTVEQPATLTPEQLAMTRHVADLGANPSQHGDLRLYLQNRSDADVNVVLATAMVGKGEFEGDFPFILNYVQQPNPHLDKRAKLAGMGRNGSYFINEGLRAMGY